MLMNLGKYPYELKSIFLGSYVAMELISGFTRACRQYSLYAESSVRPKYDPAIHNADCSLYETLPGVWYIMDKKASKLQGPYPKGPWFGP